VHLRRQAKHGNKAAIEFFETEPVVPDEVRYLLGWLDMLYGRSGAHMSGLNPLTYTTIESWQRSMDIQELSPMEVEALLILDAARMFEYTPEADKEEEAPIVPRVYPQWPTRKQ